MALSCGASAFAVETSSDCLSALYVLTENKKILAPESQIIEYVQAKTEEERAQALHKLKADPQNEVYEIRDGGIGIVPVDEAETGENFATPSSERTTEKWVLSNYEIGAGKIMKVFRSGRIAFTLEEKNTLKVHLYFEGTREFGVRYGLTTPIFTMKMR